MLPCRKFSVIYLFIFTLSTELPSSDHILNQVSFFRCRSPRIEERGAGGADADETALGAGEHAVPEPSAQDGPLPRAAPQDSGPPHAQHAPLGEAAGL